MPTTPDTTEISQDNELDSLVPVSETLNIVIDPKDSATDFKIE